jgi:hypothetical protein
MADLSHLKICLSVTDLHALVATVERVLPGKVAIFEVAADSRAPYLKILGELKQADCKMAAEKVGARVKGDQNYNASFLFAIHEHEVKKAAERRLAQELNKAISMIIGGISFIDADAGAPGYSTPTRATPTVADDGQLSAEGTSKQPRATRDPEQPSDASKALFSEPPH